MSILYGNTVKEGGVCIFLSLLLVSFHATAQTPDSNAEQRAQRGSDAQLQRESIQRQQEERERALQIPDGRLPQATRGDLHSTALPSDAVCFTIHAFDFDIPAHLSAAQQRAGANRLFLDPFYFLRERSESYRGRCVGEAGLNVILRRLQAEVLRRGYATTQLGIAAGQDLASGLFTFTLIPGVVRDMRFDPPTQSESWRTAMPMRTGDALQLRDLEQGLENLKRVPSQDVDIAVVPGDSPGDSDVLIRQQKKFPLRLALGLNDGGLKDTGRRQAALNVSLDNPFGLSDVLSMGLSTDAERAGQLRGTRGSHVGYSLPYGYWHVGLWASSYQYHQQIAGRFQAFTSSGKSRNLEFRLAHVVQRDQLQTNTLQFRTGKRWSYAFIDTIELQNQRHNTTFAEVAWIYRRYLGNARLDMTLANRWGVNWFNGAADSALRKPDEPTYRYTLQTIDATLTKPFAIASQPIILITNLRAQHSQSVLYAVDKLSIGGRNSVRGFDGNLNLSAERGFFVRNEIDMPLGRSLQSMYAGLDAGKLYGPGVQFLAGDKLAGAVWGLRGNLKGLSYDAFIGWPLHKPRNFRTSAQSAGLNLVYQY